LHSSKYSSSESYNSCPQCNLYLGRKADLSVALPDRTLETLIDKILFPELARADREAECEFYRKRGIERKTLPGQEESEELPEASGHSKKQRHEEEDTVQLDTEAGRELMAAPEGSTVLLELIPETPDRAAGESEGSTLKLDLPFLKMLGSVRVDQLKRYIGKKLNREDKLASLELRCMSEPLQSDMTVADVKQSIWSKADNSSAKAMQCTYRFITS